MSEATILRDIMLKQVLSKEQSTHPHYSKLIAGDPDEFSMYTGYLDRQNIDFESLSARQVQTMVHLDVSSAIPYWDPDNDLASPESLWFKLAHAVSLLDAKLDSKLSEFSTKLDILNSGIRLTHQKLDTLKQDMDVLLEDIYEDDPRAPSIREEMGSIDDELDPVGMTDATQSTESQSDESDTENTEDVASEKDSVEPPLGNTTATTDTSSTDRIEELSEPDAPLLHLTNISNDPTLPSKLGEYYDQHSYHADLSNVKDIVAESEGDASKRLSYLDSYVIQAIDLNSYDDEKGALGFIAAISRELATDSVCILADARSATLESLGTAPSISKCKQIFKEFAKATSKYVYLLEGTGDDLTLYLNTAENIAMVRKFNITYKNLLLLKQLEHRTYSMKQIVRIPGFTNKHNTASILASLTKDKLLNQSGYGDKMKWSISDKGTCLLTILN